MSVADSVTAELEDVSSFFKSLGMGDLDSDYNNVFCDLAGIFESIDVECDIANIGEDIDRIMDTFNGVSSELYDSMCNFLMTKIVGYFQRLGLVLSHDVTLEICSDIARAIVFLIHGDTEHTLNYTTNLTYDDGESADVVATVLSNVVDNDLTPYISDVSDIFITRMTEEIESNSSSLDTIVKLSIISSFIRNAGYLPKLPLMDQVLLGNYIDADLDATIIPMISNAVENNVVIDRTADEIIAIIDRIVLSFLLITEEDNIEIIIMYLCGIADRVDRCILNRGNITERVVALMKGNPHESDK